jgi:RimJ/RimL family protein N-acetyltransferase
MTAICWTHHAGIEVSALQFLPKAVLMFSMPAIPDDSQTIHDEGGRLFLRMLCETDIDDEYVSWFRNEDVTRFLEARNISRQDAIDHLNKGLSTGTYFVYAIIDKETGLHLGNTKIGPVHWKDGLADYSIIIGRQDFWGRGVACEATRLSIRIAFDVYGIRKLTAGIIEGNEGSVRAVIKAGFTIDARLKDHYLIDGELRDRIVLACFNPAFPQR